MVGVREWVPWKAPPKLKKSMLDLEVVRLEIEDKLLPSGRKWDCRETVAVRRRCLGQREKWEKK
jgi:hypothetical protein